MRATTLGRPLVSPGFAGGLGPGNPGPALIPRDAILDGPLKAGALGTFERNVRFGHLVVEPPRYHES
jgi:hypothetical protein